MWGCVTGLCGACPEENGGMMTGVNAAVYGCIRGRVWEGVSTGVEVGVRSGVRLH